jgi:hypothetical protein
LSPPFRRLRQRFGRNGALLKQDDDANKRLYGRTVVPKEILFTSEVVVPRAARPLDAALTKYSPRGGAPFTKTS